MTTDDEKAKARRIGLAMMRAQAMSSTINEVLRERKEEIIERATAKLVAMGVSVEDASEAARATDL